MKRRKAGKRKEMGRGGEGGGYRGKKGGRQKGKEEDKSTEERA